MSTTIRVELDPRVFQQFERLIGAIESVGTQGQRALEPLTGALTRMDQAAVRTAKDITRLTREVKSNRISNVRNSVALNQGAVSLGRYGAAARKAGAEANKMGKFGKKAANAFLEFGRGAEDFAIGYEMSGFQGAVRGSINNFTQFSMIVGGPVIGAIAGVVAGITFGLVPRLLDTNRELEAAKKTLREIKMLDDRRVDPVKHASALAKIGTLTSTSSAKGQVASLKEQLDVIRAKEHEQVDKKRKLESTLAKLESDSEFRDYVGTRPAAIKKIKAGLAEVQAELNKHSDNSQRISIRLAAANKRHWDLLVKDMWDRQKEVANFTSGLANKEAVLRANLARKVTDFEIATLGEKVKKFEGSFRDLSRLIDKHAAAEKKQIKQKTKDEIGAANKTLALEKKKVKLIDDAGKRRVALDKAVAQHASSIRSAQIREAAALHMVDLAAKKAKHDRELEMIKKRNARIQEEERRHRQIISGLFDKIGFTQKLVGSQTKEDVFEGIVRNRVQDAIRQRQFTGPSPQGPLGAGLSERELRDIRVRTRRHARADFNNNRIGAKEFGSAMLDNTQRTIGQFEAQGALNQQGAIVAREQAKTLIEQQRFITEVAQAQEKTSQVLKAIQESSRRKRLKAQKSQ